MDPNKNFSIGQTISIKQCLFIIRHIGKTDNIMILEEISGEDNEQNNNSSREREERRNRD